MVLPILYAIGNELEHNSVILGLQLAEATGKSVYKSGKHVYSPMSSPTITQSH